MATELEKFSFHLIPKKGNAKECSNYSTIVLMSHASKEMKVKLKLLRPVRLFATPWTVAYQAPLSMEFSRREYWSGLLFPSPGDLPEPGNTEPTCEDWDLLLLLLNLFMYLRKFCQNTN